MLFIHFSLLQIKFEDRTFEMPELLTYFKILSNQVTFFNIDNTLVSDILSNSELTPCSVYLQLGQLIWPTCKFFVCHKDDQPFNVCSDLFLLKTLGIIAGLVFLAEWLSSFITNYKGEGSTIPVHIMKTLPLIDNCFIIPTPIGMPLHLNFSALAVTKVHGHITPVSLPSIRDLWNSRSLPEDIKVAVDIKPRFELLLLIIIITNNYHYYYYNYYCYYYYYYYYYYYCCCCYFYRL